MRERSSKSRGKPQPQRLNPAMPIEAPTAIDTLQLIADAGTQWNTLPQFIPARTEAERATLVQREELILLLREKK